MEGAPTQTGGDDCGVYVLKYMEAVAAKGKKSISWENLDDWQNNMPKFRAEIAVEMIEVFTATQ